MAQKLPRAIQEQVEAAEKLQQNIYGNGEQQLEAPQVDEQPAPETPADELQDTKGEVGLDNKPAEQVQQEQVKQQAPESDPNSETWEHKYRSMQGRYDAEVPRLHSQIKQLKNDLRDAIQRIEELNKANLEPKVEEKPVGITENDAETFGKDLVEFTSRVAREEAERRSKEATAAAKRAETAAQELAAKQAAADYDRFLSKVTQRLPNWEEINSTPEFLAWLSEYDPLVRGQRQLALDSAAQALDVEGTVEVFKTYLLTREQVQTPPVVNKAAQEQITPKGTGSQGRVATPQDKRIYTQAEISQLLSPQRLFKLPLAEQQRIEREIDLAAAEGRIR